MRIRTSLFLKEIIYVVIFKDDSDIRKDGGYTILKISSQSVGRIGGGVSLPFCCQGNKHNIFNVSMSFPVYVSHSALDFIYTKV